MTEMIYGPNTAQVQVRLEQLRRLDPEQFRALDEIWEMERAFGWDDAWVAGWEAASLEAQRRRRTAALDALQGLVGGARLGHGWAALLAEVVADRIEPAQHLLLVAPLDMVLGLPNWWDEAGSRNLFREMRIEGVGVKDAVRVVTALV